MVFGLFVYFARKFSTFHPPIEKDTALKSKSCPIGISCIASFYGQDMPLSLPYKCDVIWIRQIRIGRQRNKDKFLPSPRNHMQNGYSAVRSFRAPHPACALLG